ncbi:flagellar biosynthesis anti-sigma factor FlgM [Pseudoduganella violacea]|uniref:Negative regulator of flagellin synthesis n=1 Tax=Pseudoduganella violacea TaxID=1715466 RepID=A0A7W5BDH2_9BURK|nr:flagellar biosynthesis anti-sigma factor FlgM [Pseudoduganella violacea]MBB3120821.1 negative regulator of flagellin synthesis FlgM [Pseudoduganella violacea]
MRITTATPGGVSVQQVSEVTAADGAHAAAAPSAPAELQSAVLQPALQALRDLPDIDHEKVAQLRDALAKGELPFNAGKLAGLIQRFHGSEK